MSSITNAVRGIRNIWNHGDDDDYAPEDLETPDTAPAYQAPSPRDKYTSQQTITPSSFSPSYGGGSGGNPPANSAARRLRPVAAPLRQREKNIYTLKPKNQDEATIAADYLKTGSAVVLNLDEVDRVMATRIIDFMSGVCYGLDAQGHAMKLGDTIFLFTPGEFEISSDETDYAENRELFFKDAPASSETPSPRASAAPAQSAQPAPQSAPTASSQTPPLPSRERRAWEQTQ